MRRLMAYHWPGNVRQLENAIERAVAFSAGRSQIDVGDLPTGDSAGAGAARSSSPVTLPEDGVDLDAFIANIERELIQRSLERTGGNKGQAARLLNLKRTTLVEKLKRLEKRVCTTAARFRRHNSHRISTPQTSHFARTVDVADRTITRSKSPTRALNYRHAY